MLEFHVLTSRGAELVMQVVGGRPLLPPDHQRLERRAEIEAKKVLSDSQPLECAPARPGEVIRHE